MTLPGHGILLGRVWNPTVGGVSVVTVRDGRVIDITSRRAPTVRDVCEMDDPAVFVAGAEGRDLGAVEDIAGAAVGGSGAHFLAPCDLQVI